MEDDFINLIGTTIKDGFNSLIGKNNVYKKDTKGYLDNEINKFFKKEKRFKRNKLLLYYDFNRKISEIISTPYYMSLFYENMNHIVHNCIYSPWDNIMETYKKVVKKNPNYKNSRLDTEKAVYDRRYMLLIVYYIYIIYIYIISSRLYIFISQTFYKIIDKLNIRDSNNGTLIIFILYLGFILGVYYGGIDFLIFVIVLLWNIIWYICVIIFYTIYYLLWGLFILVRLMGKGAVSTVRVFVGGKKQKKLQGGGIYEEFDEFINDMKKTIDKVTIDFVVNVLNKLFMSAMPDDIFETDCKSTSNIEQMIAKHNVKRNINEDINITGKISQVARNNLPDSVKNNKFVQCMIKPMPKKPEKCPKD